MNKFTLKEIRNIWIKFFEEKGHKFVPSSSLIPINDDSLLFINSGVATLKKYFSGEEVPPSKRMVNIQKAIRTGDIENVGITTRHHTFFEMMGNFSIGDYFKEEAISWGWELLTSSKYYNIPKEKLFVTVFEEDKDALGFWKKTNIDDSHIIIMGRETNFWDMGVGPSGPSTEIFFDKGEKYDSRDGVLLIGEDIENDRFVEIWNIVFSQFNNDGKNNYTELPQKNIDTGAGFERLVSCLQDKPTNFETDLFEPLIKEIEKYSKYKYKYDYVPSLLLKENEKQFKINSYFKGIADFSRTLTFAISDGVIPSPNGRGYVLRKILRRAMMFAKKLEINELIISKLSIIVSEIMKDFYPEINLKIERIIETILSEEKQFIKTLENGIELFENETNTKEKIMSFDEKKAFRLFETYGLQMELIIDLSLQKGIKLNQNKINELMKDFSNLSKENSKKVDAMKVQENLFVDIDETKFVGYKEFKSTSKVIAIENEYVVFDKTPFYATSGGQESDFGFANKFKVEYVSKNGSNVFIHKIPKNNFTLGQNVELKIDKDRRKKLTNNHSSIHLMFSALEKIYGFVIPQVGSKVESNFFRFDISIQEKVTEEIIEQAENIANTWVDKNTKSVIKEMPLNEAKKINAGYLEGTKYGEIVRVVKLNDETIDLCGGTHVKNTGEIERIKITSFKKRGSGVYRIEGISGKDEIREFVQKENLEYFFKQKEQLDKMIKNIESKYYSIMESDVIFENIEFSLKEMNNFEGNDFKKNFNNKTHEIEIYLNSIEKELNKKLEEKVNEYLNQEIKFIKMNFEGIKIKEVDKLILNKLNKMENRKVFVTLSYGDLVTVALFLTPDLVNDENIKKYIDDIKEIGFKGNGRNQMYVFGGNKELLLNLKRKLILWE